MMLESSEQCLEEAAECDRLAALARSIAMRQILLAMALKWRGLAKAAAKRSRERHPQTLWIFEGPNEQ
jgi:hypothetical protein